MKGRLLGLWVWDGWLVEMMLVPVEVELLALVGSPEQRQCDMNVVVAKSQMTGFRYFSSLTEHTSLPPSSEQRPGKVDEQEVEEGQEEQARPGVYIFPPERLPA